MTKLLRLIAGRLAIQYDYGTERELSIAADAQRAGDGMLMFYDPYKPKQLTQQGNVPGITKRTPLTVYFWLPTVVDEPTETRLPKIEQCEAMAVRAYNMLTEYSDVTNVTLEPVLAADNPLCGILMTGTFISEPESTCL